MVLINGVKYACERCIRGHRVTTCTHTDQPLTMIKPKGRPSTQCQHCRDQRKMKNLHTTCTCGKKGKSPGTHLASCLCHKNSHCTCSHKQPTKQNPGSIHHMSASERAKKKSLIDAANADIKKKSTTTTTTTASTVPTPPKTLQLSPYPSLSNNFVIEDIILPFDTGHGLFDLFSNHSDGGNTSDFKNGSQESTPAANANPVSQTNHNSKTNINAFENNNEAIADASTNKSARATTVAAERHSNNDSVNGYATDSKKVDNASVTDHLSPTEVDLVDNMFPLFPLVGSQSFDTENQPLLPFPPPERSHTHPMKVTQHPKPIRPAVNTQTCNPIIPSSSVNSTNSINTGNTSGYSSSTFQATKLKRPESVLSITSNSSSRSFDVYGPGYPNHSSSFISGGSFPTSSAYPPSNPFHDFSQPQSATSEDNLHTHHFGRTGLGSGNIGTQLSKIESELYTENFFDEPIENNGQNQLSASSSIPNFYSVGTGNNSNNNNNTRANQSASDLTYPNQNGSTTDLQYVKNLDYDIPLYQELFGPLNVDRSPHLDYQAQTLHREQRLQEDSYLQNGANHNQ